MKQFSFLFLALILVLMSSCESGIIKVNTKDYLIYQALVDADLIEYYRRNEARSEVNEMALDKSEPYRLRRMAYLLSKIEKIDTSSQEFFKEINDLKTDMFSDKWKLKDGLAKIENSRIGMPLRFKEEDFKLNSTKKVEKRLEKIRNAIEQIRRTVCVQLVNYSSRNGDDYHFTYQKINKFDSLQELCEKLETLIEVSNVNQDDREVLKSLYVILTKLITQKPEDLNSPIDIFSYLTSLERAVNGALADANVFIRLRTGCCENYKFDKILPMVECPSIVYVGDTIEVSTLMVAFYSYANTSATVNGQAFPIVKEGINYINLVVPNKKEWTLNGEVSVKNKSGIPKSMPWKKTIKILPRE